MLPWLIVAGMIYAMRRLERWLHQHIFKVGWLLTKNLRTTTILYYTFFLPGVVLHEVVYWLVAGILNVRAESVFQYPEAQSIAELKLNFVRLPRNVGQVKLAIISTAPLVIGLMAVYGIANGVLSLHQAVELLAQPGGLFANLGAAVNTIIATPDVWLWTYIAFTIANTMTPDWGALKGWRVILTAVVLVLLLLFFLGVADEVFFNALAQPLQDGINVLSLTIAAIIGIDLLMTAVLGGLESIIERVTGDSATFQNGKLVAMRREEIIRLREQQRAKQERQLQAAKKRELAPASIYALPLSIPTSPSKDLDPIIVTPDDQSVLPEPEARTPERPEPLQLTQTSSVSGLASAPDDDDNEEAVSETVVEELAEADNDESDTDETDAEAETEEERL